MPSVTPKEITEIGDLDEKAVYTISCSGHYAYPPVQLTWVKGAFFYFHDSTTLQNWKIELLYNGIWWCPLLAILILVMILQKQWLPEGYIDFCFSEIGLLLLILKLSDSHSGFLKRPEKHYFW